jgi:hypothetical protein
MPLRKYAPHKADDIALWLYQACIDKKINKCIELEISGE